MRSELAIAEGGPLAAAASDRWLALAFVVLLSLPARSVSAGTRPGPGRARASRR